MNIGYPTSSRPHINANHIDGPLLVMRDGRLHFLNRWERLLLTLGLTDALKLEAKHWLDRVGLL